MNCEIKSCYDFMKRGYAALFFESFTMLLKRGKTFSIFFNSIRVSFTA